MSHPMEDEVAEARGRSQAAYLAGHAAGIAEGRASLAREVLGAGSFATHQTRAERNIEALCKAALSATQPAPDCTHEGIGKPGCTTCDPRTFAQPAPRAAEVDAVLVFLAHPSCHDVSPVRKDRFVARYTEDCGGALYLRECRGDTPEAACEAALRALEPEPGDKP